MEVFNSTLRDEQMPPLEDTVDVRAEGRKGVEVWNVAGSLKTSRQHKQTESSRSCHTASLCHSATPYDCTALHSFHSISERQCSINAALCSVQIIHHNLCARPTNLDRTHTTWRVVAINNNRRRRRYPIVSVWSKRGSCASLTHEVERLQSCRNTKGKQPEMQERVYACVCARARVCGWVCMCVRVWVWVCAHNL